MSGLEDMIHVAEGDLGLGEPNKIQDWYRKRNGSAYGGNFPWCDAAVTYWAWHSGNEDAVTFGHDYALTTAHASAFKTRDRWHVDIAGIKRGDIVFFDWAGSDTPAAIDHVGIVTGTDGGRVYTIEGNYDDKCARHVRTAGMIAGYGRPSYGGPPSHGGPGIVVTFPGKSFFVMGRRSPIIAAMHNTARRRGLQQVQDADEQGRLGSRRPPLLLAMATQTRLPRLDRPTRQRRQWSPAHTLGPA